MNMHMYFLVERNNVTSISEFSDIYELSEEKSLQSTFPGTFYSFMELYCDVGWTFGDTLIALVSIILTRFFIRLNKGISESKARTVEDVEGLRKDHRSIKDLVEVFIWNRIYLNKLDNLINVIFLVYSNPTTYFPQ